MDASMYDRQEMKAHTTMDYIAGTKSSYVVDTLMTKETQSIIVNNIELITKSDVVTTIMKNLDVIKKNSYLLLMTEFHLPEHILMHHISMTTESWFRSTKTYVVDQFEYALTDRRENERKIRRIEEAEEKIREELVATAKAEAFKKAELLAVEKAEAEATVKAAEAKYEAARQQQQAEAEATAKAVAEKGAQQQQMIQELVAAAAAEATAKAKEEQYNTLTLVTGACAFLGSIAATFL